MIKNFIIGLSILFFALSGLVTFKALGIRTDKPRYENSPQGLEAKGFSSGPEDIPGQFDKGQTRQSVKEQAGKSDKERTTDRALIEQLQAAVSELEEKVSNRNEELRGNGTKGSPGKTRVIGILGDGEFRPGQDAVNENMIKAVEELLPYILKFSDHRIVIEGHTDNSPIGRSAGKKYMDNMELSFLRAKAVALVLAKKGIPLERISVIGHGDTHPIASNETDEGRARNRRVEVKLIPADREF